MSTKAVDKKVLEVIREVLGEGADLTGMDPNTPLNEVSAIDSLSALRIMVALENRFRIKFDLDSLDETFHSVGTLARYIEAKTGKGSR